MLLYKLANAHISQVKKLVTLVSSLNPQQRKAAMKPGSTTPKARHAQGIAHPKRGARSSAQKAKLARSAARTLLPARDSGKKK